MESLKKCHLESFYKVAAIFVLSWNFIQAGDCPADGRTWVTFGEDCYHFIHGEEDIAKSYTITSAKLICKEFGLVKIRSADENAFVVQYSPNVWKNNINVWLDVYYDSDNDSLKWSDETPLSFRNWEEEVLNPELAPIDTCVTLHTHTGKWENVSCTEGREHGVVCQTAQKSEETGNNKGSPLLSALVIISVVLIVGVSAGIWFLHQRNQTDSSIFTSFEYHPPFRSPTADQTCLVEAEETDEMP